MRAIPDDPEIFEAARRIIWFEPPEKALEDPIRFMAYAMNHGFWEDVRPIFRWITQEELREAIECAPPGIMNPRAWAYWNAKIGRSPAPPMPRRRVPVAR